jgi:8-oxo-dGTP pyrophosphatase MutT (NUDIX family)
MSLEQIEGRLRSAFAGTGELPRPVAQLELPEGVTLSDDYIAGLRPAAVLVPILLREKGSSLVLTQRAEGLRNHAGQISLPGGLREESDASAADAALREAHEEIGLAPESVDVIGYLGDYPTITGFRVTPAVGLIHQDFVPIHDAGEVAAVFEVPLDVVLDPTSYQRKTFIRNNQTLPYFELQYREFRIWGATAGILREFAQHVASRERPA